MTRSLEEIEFTDVCPHCGRLLVTSYTDGRFDLAGEAETATEAIIMRGETEALARPVQGTAVCNRRRCVRARRRASARGG